MRDERFCLGVASDTNAVGIPSSSLSLLRERMMGVGPHLTLRREVRVRTTWLGSSRLYMWLLGCAPVWAKCIDCETTGLLGVKFASYIPGRLGNRLLTGVGTCIDCSHGLDQYEDPPVTNWDRPEPSWKDEVDA